jgi:hypothetical protein
MSKDHAAGLRAAAQAFLEIIDLVTRRKASVLRPRRRERTPRGVEEIGVRLCPIRVSGVRRAIGQSSRAVGSNADRPTFLFDPQGEGRRR